jgi:hypothetical protein
MTPKFYEPTVIDQGVLKTKTVAAIAATGSRAFALCMDGTMAIWGDINSPGILAAGRAADGIAGLPTPTNKKNTNGGGLSAPQSAIINERLKHYSDVPITLVDGTGALNGKTITTLVGPYMLCSDGTLVYWAPKNVPNPVVMNQGALEGKPVTAVVLGSSESGDLALCSDGTLVRMNFITDSGSNGDPEDKLPYAVDTTGAANPLNGKKITLLGPGMAVYQNPATK